MPRCLDSLHSHSQASPQTKIGLLRYMFWERLEKQIEIMKQLAGLLMNAASFLLFFSIKTSTLADAPSSFQLKMEEFCLQLMWERNLSMSPMFLRVWWTLKSNIHIAGACGTRACGDMGGFWLLEINT